MYKNRFYRVRSKDNDLIGFEVEHFESSLMVLAGKNLQKEAKKLLIKYHGQIRRYIDKNPEFEKTLVPLKRIPEYPRIIKIMSQAAQKAGVGPMASVAGAVAQFVGKGLLAYSDEVIVENGGDIFISIKKDRHIGIFAGIGSAYNDLSLLIQAKDTPCGICASSGVIGHSLSLGRSNATIVIARTAAIADAYATAIGNLVQNEDDAESVIVKVKDEPQISGVVVIIKNKMAAWGNIKFS